MILLIFVASCGFPANPGPLLVLQYLVKYFVGLPKQTHTGVAEWGSQINTVNTGQWLVHLGATVNTFGAAWKVNSG